MAIKGDFHHLHNAPRGPRLEGTRGPTCTTQNKAALGWPYAGLLDGHHQHDSGRPPGGRRLGDGPIQDLAGMPKTKKPHKSQTNPTTKLDTEAAAAAGVRRCQTEAAGRPFPKETKQGQENKARESVQRYVPAMAPASPQVGKAPRHAPPKGRKGCAGRKEGRRGQKEGVKRGLLSPAAFLCNHDLSRPGTPDPHFAHESKQG
jgi:hypothetical protein